MDKNQIKNLVRQMTLKEKAGQVTQLPSRYFQIKGSQLTGTENKLGITECEKWQAGSTLGKMDAESMRNIQAGEYETEPPQDSNDVYDRYHSWISDDFPVPLAMSCSFNPELVERVQLCLQRRERCWISGYVSPMVDVVRDPRWGRVMKVLAKIKD